MTSESTSPTTIKSALQQIRGDLFDVDSSNVTLVKILDKVQQLTEAENEVVERQKEEIERLRAELSSVRQQQHYHERERQQREEQRDDYDVISSGSFSSSTTEDSYTESSKQAADFDQTKEAVSAEIAQLNDTKSKIHQEIDTLRHQVGLLVEERTTLIKEVQVYTHMKEVSDELDEATEQISTLQHQVKGLQSQLLELTNEKEAALQRIETQTLIRQEMEKEMRILYEEKITLENMLEDRNTIATVPSSSVASSSYEEDIERLKREISIMRAENESLRVTAKREAATIQGLNDEIKSLNQENLVIRNSFEDSREVMSAVRKRNALAWSQGLPGDHDSEYKRSIGYEPRERLGSMGNSSGDNSNSHESDNVSVLFGQDSIAGKSVTGHNKQERSVVSCDDASDHKSIRAHAEKLLYWANKAAERSKSPSRGSIASGSYSARPVVSHHSSVPTTIGLPPRGSATKKNVRSLPPRPPSDCASTFSNATNKSDKENGGGLNVPKRANSDKAVIFNLEKVESSSDSCKCSTSPFSGNDAHSEFYLPKLGLACTCGQSSNIEDRASFSKNPTSLQNILRSWQCDFLATLGIHTADQLLRAHKNGANDMARRMKRWREENSLPLARSKECYVALMVWARTAKVVLRSIEKQKEAGEEFIEKPGFLDITYSDTYTVCSVSTLGQMSWVGGRVNEMMEI
eukprot:CCRYP_008545-RA/>CCRYP_008545-RA protein AED:0.28 eAED:0.28 QI:0/-1/0/1/-1/1/1/0/690